MPAALGAAEAPGWRSLLGVNAVLRAQGADPDRIRRRSPRLVALAEQALRLGMPLLAPSVICQRYPVLGRYHGGLRLGDGGRLTGRLVATECALAEELVIIGVTIGAALESRAAEAMACEPGLGLALDGLGTAAVEALATSEAARVAAEATAAGSAAGPPLSPGMEGWPLPLGQSEVFRLLGEDSHRIRLSERGMLTPVKSLTLVIGLGPAMRSGASACDFCGCRDRCRHRRAR